MNVGAAITAAMREQRDRDLPRVAASYSPDLYRTVLIGEVRYKHWLTVEEALADG